MSSINDTAIISINNATIQLNRYFPILMYIFGTIGNILNILILSRRALRSNPCAFLLLASSITGLIVIISGLTTRLTAGWVVDLSETNGWLCKLRIIVLFVSRTMAVWFLVIATIDRYCLSHLNASRRNLSSLKHSQQAILIVTICSLMLNSPLLYCYEANLIGTPAKCFGFSESCRLYTDLSFTFGTIVVPSFLMMLFGLLTIQNIRQARLRIMGEGTSDKNSTNVSKMQDITQQQQKKTDRSLFKMLCVQVLFLILCTAPYTIYRIYITFSPTTSSNSAFKTAVERFLFNLCTNLTYLSTAIPFYIYTLCGGKAFRRELILMMTAVYLHMIGIFKN